jgi:ubiquinone/menaquinone biosynthesis C-methylase UbiE
MVTPSPRLTGVAERMEQPGLHPAELVWALETLARVNRYSGGTRLVLRYLERLCDRLPAPIRILDVGTGYADIPRAIVRWARRRGRRIEITGLDRHTGTLALAHRACGDYPEIRLQQGDALALPFPSGSFDVVLASQILHHMEGNEPVQLLRELARVARRGILVHDLRRGTWPHLATWVTLRIVCRNPVVRHDGPLSIRRGYVPAELRSLAKKAGWRAPRLARHAFFRLVLVEETP